VNLRIALVKYTESNNLVPDNIRPNALQYYEVEQKVHEALQGDLTIEIHKLVEPKPNDMQDDYHDRIDMAKAALQKGIAFEILPEVSADMRDVRAIVFPNYSMPKANPDYRDKYTGKYYDLKRPESMKNVMEIAKKAVLEQDAIAIISRATLPPLSLLFYKHRLIFFASQTAPACIR
jgi:hypothetical protein